MISGEKKPMEFSTITFLFYFLPLVLFLYFTSRSYLRNIILVLSSLFFYAWGEPIYVTIMLFSTIVDFTLGKLIFNSQQKNKKGLSRFFLICSVVINLGLLIFFKYSSLLVGTVNDLINFSLTIPKIALPIGISFYTFQTMSYSIDVYRKKVKPQNNFLSFATYVTLFPQLIAGPIVRYQTIESELSERKENLDHGIKLFILGLSQKVLLANNIGLAFEEYKSGGIPNPSALTSWFIIIAFAFQIYFDFCGYSNMAIGLGEMFGFHFPINFNKPYLAKNISDFWQRWHISLTTWFKEYVYIPLGGNRKGTAAAIRNIIIVWFLTGIWHGASWNFLLWGAYFAILLIVEKYFLKKWLDLSPAFIKYIYTIILVLIGWVLFAFEDFTDMLVFFKNLFAINGLIDDSFFYLARNYFVIMALCTIASTNLSRKIFKVFIRYNWLKTIIYIGIFILSICYIISSGYNPFLYFRF